MHVRIILAIAALFGLGVGSAQAGLYNPAEPEEDAINVHDFARFDQAMENLRMISWPKVPFEYPLRTRYVMAAELDARGIPRAWSSRERLGLSAYLIRREKYRDAQQLLERTIQQEPHNFVALANLAAAYQNDRVDEAISYARRAIKSWPEWQALTKEQQELMKQLRWDPEQFEHYRRVEPYFLKLMERRRKEAPKQPMATEKLDPLFGDDKDSIRFVGDSGRFEPGKLAAAERKKLPDGNVIEAIRIVQQLLLWTPGDARLLWQLAELYNAAGKQVIGDKTIDHRVTAHKIYDILTNPFGAYKYRPRELLDNKETLAKDLQSNPPPPEKAADDGAPGGRSAPNDDDTGSVSWRTLFIGLAAGLIVALFVSWQFHEIRRRAQRRAAAKPLGMQGRNIAGELGDTRVQVGHSPIVPAPDTHVRAADKPTKP